MNDGAATRKDRIIRLVGDQNIGTLSRLKLGLGGCQYFCPPRVRVRASAGSARLGIDLQTQPQNTKTDTLIVYARSSRCAFHTRIP